MHLFLSELLKCKLLLSDSPPHIISNRSVLLNAIRLVAVSVVYYAIGVTEVSFNNKIFLEPLLGYKYVSDYQGIILSIFPEYF